MTVSPRVGRLPWAVRDLVRLYVANVVALGLVLCAWYGAAGTVRGTRQVEWLALGAVGVVVAGTGDGLWLLAARRAIATRRGTSTSAIAAVLEQLDRRSAGVVATPARPGGLVVLPGSHLVHRHDCQLIAGKPVQPAGEELGLQACGICAT